MFDQMWLYTGHSAMFDVLKWHGWATNTCPVIRAHRNALPAASSSYCSNLRSVNWLATIPPPSPSANSPRSVVTTYRTIKLIPCTLDAFWKYRSWRSSCILTASMALASILVSLTSIQQMLHYYTKDVLILTASMSPASLESSTSRSTSISVLQLTGCFPLPLSHSSRISVLICSASFPCLCSMLQTLVPVESSKRRMPNKVYLVLISWGMLILLSLPRNLTSSTIVGGMPAVENASFTIKTNQVYWYINTWLNELAEMEEVPMCMYARISSRLV